MQPTIITILLLLSLIINTVVSQLPRCVYIANGIEGRKIECNEPAKDIAEISFTQGQGNNNITEIKKGLFKPFKNLKSIYIYKGNVQKIEPGSFDGLQLRKLSLHNNDFKIIENGTLNSLNTTSRFEVTRNQLESLGADMFLGMTSLTWIHLNGNKIKIIDKAAFNGLDKLEYLYLYDNKLESFEVGTFDSLVSLKLLYVTDNFLRTLEFGLFSQQRRLEDLFLENNKLEGFPDYLFANLSVLQTIDISQNKIRELQEKLFYGIENLQTLKFASNNITQFDVKIFAHIPKLTHLELHDNPWKCEALKKLRGPLEIQKLVVPVPVPVHDAPNIDAIGCIE